MLSVSCLHPFTYVFTLPSSGRRPRSGFGENECDQALGAEYLVHRHNICTTGSAQMEKTDALSSLSLSMLRPRGEVHGGWDRGASLQVGTGRPMVNKTKDPQENHRKAAHIMLEALPSALPRPHLALCNGGRWIRSTSWQRHEHEQDTLAQDSSKGAGAESGE